MKAENLYHTGIVVDDLQATMEWLAKVAGYTWTDVVSVDQEAVTPDGEVTIPMKMVYWAPNPGWSSCRPCRALCGLPRTRGCITSAIGPTMSNPIWPPWNPMV